MVKGVSEVKEWEWRVLQFGESGSSESGRHGTGLGTGKILLELYCTSSVRVGAIIALMGMWGSIVSYRIKRPFFHIFLSYRTRSDDHDPSFASVVKQKGERKGTDTYLMYVCM